MADFKTGDIMGVKAFDLPGILVQLGEFISHPRFGFEYSYTHVGIIYVKDSEAYVAEAVGDGVKLTPLTAYAKQKFTVGTIATLTAANRLAIQTDIEATIGEKLQYNWFQLYWLAFAKLLKLEFIRNPFSSKKKTICSEYVQDRLSKVDILFKDAATQNVDPRDIMCDARVQLYYTHNC